MKAVIIEQRSHPLPQQPLAAKLCPHGPKQGTTELLRLIHQKHQHHQHELVASFVNRSNLLKSWENTDTYAISTAGAHGPKNTAITRIPTHALPESCTH